MSAYGVETLEGRMLLSAAATFAAPSIYTSGQPAHSIAFADFNGDGFQDIAVTNPINDSVTILLNKGDGTFAKAAPVKLQHPVAVVAGDFNGDGKQDLALITDIVPSGKIFNLAGSATTTDTLVLFLGNGNGSFVRSTAYRVVQGGRRIVAADFNGDGLTDLALSGPHAVAVIINDGVKLAPEVRYRVSDGSIEYLTNGDFNGDGKSDLVVALPQQKGIRVLINNGDGTFFRERTTLLGIKPTWLAVGDFNGDGKQDVAAVDGTFRQGIFLRLGTGSGTFSKAPVVIHSGPFLQSIAAADLNGDGSDDLAVVDFTSTLRIATSNGDGTFQQSTPLPGAGPAGFAIYSEDLNGDGKNDLILLRSGDVYVYLNTTP